MDYEGLQSDLYYMAERAYVTALRDREPRREILEFMLECGDFRREIVERYSCARTNG